MSYTFIALQRYSKLRRMPNLFSFFFSFLPIIRFSTRAVKGLHTSMPGRNRIGESSGGTQKTVKREEKNKVFKKKKEGFLAVSKKHSTFATRFVK